MTADLSVVPRQVDSVSSVPLDGHRRTLLFIFLEDTVCAGMVHWYGGALYTVVTDTRLKDYHSGILAGHLPSQQLPRIHIAEVRPVARTR
jgi:hypothetical protein